MPTASDDPTLGNQQSQPIRSGAKRLLKNVEWVERGIIAISFVVIWWLIQTMYADIQGLKTDASDWREKVAEKYVRKDELNTVERRIGARIGRVDEKIDRGFSRMDDKLDALLRRELDRMKYDTHPSERGEIDNASQEAEQEG